MVEFVNQTKIPRSFLNVAMMVILSNGVCCFGEYIVKMVTI